jgi:predicted KAP-like P-loop ATPase
MSNARNPFHGIFVSDNETSTDLLYFEAIAKTVVSYIEMSGTKPISIGVHGDWGAGKSSVLKMTEQHIGGKNGMLCLWFNGWQFEGFEDAKAALIENIVVELRDSRSGVKKVAAAATDVLKCLDYLKLAKVAVKYGSTFLTGIPHPGVITDAYDAFKTVAGMVAGNIDKDTISKALEDGAGLLKESKDAKKVPEEMKEFKKAFSALLDAAEITRLVVLIDDLDRCLPETAVATLEAIRLFLFIDRTAFVIGADEQMIEYSAKRHFPDFQKSGLPDSFARSYLEKLIQVPFRIPSLGAIETQCYVSLVLAEAILSKPEDKAIFDKLIEIAKASIMRPWSAQPIESKDVESVVQGDRAAALKDAVALSTQIYRVLSDGTKGNPRLIKRFLNAVLIRHAIAHERQLSGEIKLPQLSKVMLAERYNPIFFDQLVSIVSLDGSSGKPEILHLLEESPKKTEEGKAAKTRALTAENQKLLV